MQPHYGHDDNPSVIGSIRSRVSKLFGRSNASRPAGQEMQGNTSITHGHDDAAGSSSSWSLDTTPSHPPTPMLDPSTNTNPLLAQDESPGDIGADIVNKSNGKNIKKGKKRATNVSKHTFYIENSQTRLKLFARNEVCFRVPFLSYISTAQSLEQRQMLQWITALEKVAATSHYSGRNRFDSFAPIRLNVSAQWLVDGVRLILPMESEPRSLLTMIFQRDYMWNLSSAVLLARETILIHDWWLSPGTSHNLEVTDAPCHTSHRTAVEASEQGQISVR